MIIRITEKEDRPWSIKQCTLGKTKRRPSVTEATGSREGNVPASCDDSGDRTEDVLS